MAASLHSRTFGSLPTGEPVEAWTLCGADGVGAEVITYGGIVTKLLVPDRNGRLADVVLGFNDLASYCGGHPYFGAIAGRVAGRITGARFTLEGKIYKLFSNDPPNHLHGGAHGFDKKIWSARPVSAPGKAPSLRLSYCSRDGEENYLGTVNVAVTYTITADNTLLIESEAVTDNPTPFNLTHHSYFNLGGEDAGSVAGHQLRIYADDAVASDKQMTLLGRLESVAGKANDFGEPRCLGNAMPLLHQNHGDLYRIRRALPGLVHTARLTHPASGRILDVATTEAYLQFYTGAALDACLIGKSGRPYARHAGVCLECEGYPDGANVPSLGDIVLRPGKPQRQTTTYAFSIRNPTL